MSRQLWLAPFGIFTILALFFAVGCDEPNDPDIPPQPYSLRATYHAPSSIVDLSASGDHVVVALEYLGYDVIDAGNLDALSIVDTLRFQGMGMVCQVVGLDALNSIVASQTTDFGDPNRLWDYARDRRIAGFGVSGAASMDFYSRLDTTDFWYSQNTGTDNIITSSRFARLDTVWSPVTGTSWTPPNNGGGNPVRVQDFSIRSDGVMALAFQAGVHFHDSNTLQSIADLATPGRAYDCAWYGDFVVVAAEYYLLVLNAANVDSPTVVSQTEIRGADRLRQVAVDGNYAALMDDVDGIYVMDLSNISSPRLVQTITLVEPSGIGAGSGRLYIADEQRGLLIYTR